MRIVTTPMCEGVLRIAGVREYLVSRDPEEEEEADLRVVLSETDMDDALKLKLNTFSQIKDAVGRVFRTVKLMDPSILRYSSEDEIDFDVCSPWWHDPSVLRERNSKIKVKVYSNFLTEIVEDMGFRIVTDDPDFTVCPDYMELDCIRVPSHRNLPLDPVKRALFRYRYLERKLCMKP
ncbi:putative protein {ECO:0000313/EMBL:BAM70322,1} [Methanothermobacter wolfeii]|uniref:hypothetical protein n=1 Tax=Methanothermobacter wolfeii TaxID=145261 RepID=UPI00092DC87C|nr:hypothetical protein [Methanothermobacter wolfeii]SCM58335.1 putative protein {ECO:0000313/EMBL:BAM70322,1} [Methanothermobacter wolfeii]